MSPSDLLAFEAQWPRHTPAKSHAIRTRLGMSEIRYYRLLIRAASSAEGIAAHPITARMVRDRTSQGRHSRSMRAA
ncbi:DUF3263 domain-containing protein [Microbacterium sp. XT11]|uniref:DUF3263 domain-containing protein n=1 Tax=Microbacterium sp. XT11 TaxID=367477 RepID=UPI0018DD4462